MFDAIGNYLFCSPCIRGAFHITQQRLTQQRNVKRKASQHPTLKMKKTEVEEQRLDQYVVMPTECDQSFPVWWRSLESTTVVSVKYPHKRHGLAGKMSNLAKVDVMKDFFFLSWILQPNQMGVANNHMAQHTTLCLHLPLSTHQERMSLTIKRGYDVQLLGSLIVPRENPKRVNVPIVLLQRGFKRTVRKLPSTHTN